MKYFFFKVFFAAILTTKHRYISILDLLYGYPWEFVDNFYGKGKVLILILQQGNKENKWTIWLRYYGEKMLKQLWNEINFGITSLINY